MSVFGIDKLKSTVSNLGGFAKGNRYNVSFAGAGVIGLPLAVRGNIPILCEAVSLPTKGIASNAQDIYGPPREIPYRETFTEAALSFIVDDAFTIKRFFDAWQERIINPETGNVNYWTNFVATINIIRLSNDAISFSKEDASSSYHIELREAYPSAVGEIAMGHTQGNEILRLSVTFKYRKWMLLN